VAVPHVHAPAAVHVVEGVALVIMWACKAIGPLCFVLVLTCGRGGAANASKLPLLFQAWVVLEAAFFAISCILRVVLLELGRSDFLEANLKETRDTFGKDQREWYLQRILYQEITSLEIAREWLSGWFCGAPVTSLRRDNLVEFAAWAFFGSDGPNRLEADEVHEAQGVATLFAERCGMKDLSQVPEGYNESVKLMRQSIDPIVPQISHRPLLIYAALDGFLRQLLCPVVMRFLGFRLRSVRRVQYWHLPGSQAEPPVLFVHGIGVGLLPYIVSGFLPGLKASGRELIVPELPEASMSLWQNLQTAFGASVKSSEVRSSFVAILDAHNVQAVDLVGHSYGSICVGWMVKDVPARVRRVTLIEPVALLLHRSQTCRNFLYHEASSPLAQFMRYFICEEPGLVSLFMRNFTWFENNLMFQDLDRDVLERASVYLADKDEYVPSASIAESLARYQATRPDVRIRVEVRDGMHGVFVEDREWSRWILADVPAAPTA